jgi:hypothetical protein
VTTAAQLLDNPSYSICTALGDTNDIALTALNPKAHHIRLTTDTACFAALASGRVSAAMEITAGDATFCQANTDYKILMPLAELAYGPEAIGLNKKWGYGDIQALNIEIANFIGEGLVKKADDQYHLINPLPYTVPPVPAYVTSLVEQQF